MAKQQIENLKAMRIGCDHAVWVPLKTDDGITVEYDPVIYNLPGVMAININPNMSMETAFYDDGPGEVASTISNIEVTFNKSAFGVREKAMLLGKVLSVNGLLAHGGNDISPWGALGFRTLKSDGSYRYIWLLKGKFTEPADNNETKGESINFQSDEIVGRFAVLTTSFTVTSGLNQKEVKAWKTETDGICDSTDPVVQANHKALVRDWFTEVVLPNVQITI